MREMLNESDFTCDSVVVIIAMGIDDFDSLQKNARARVRAKGMCFCWFKSE